MFRLHELKRRQICRIAFVAMCIAPTTCAVAWGVSRRLSGHAEAYAAELSQVTGLRASVSSIAHPRPWATLVRDLSLTDAETGKALAQVRTLEVDFSDNEALLRASQVEIDAAGAASLWAPIDCQLRRGRDQPTCALRLIAGEATWHGTTAQTFNDIDARIASTDEGRQAEISFRPVGSEVEKPVVLRVMRRVQDGEATTHVMLETSGSPLSCALFVPWLSGIEHLGERATFVGSMEMNLTNDGW
ncbi:MAG TPA: hypothetical protein VHV77_07525, partial [Pirellulales bacterium]|nr:hypothetical protein [Pirellulales bacterium]